MGGFSILNTNNVNIGSRLKALRERKGLSMQKLTDALNDCSASQGLTLTLETYKKWEYGQNTINIKWLPAICKVCECEVGYIFGEFDCRKKDIGCIRDITGLSLLASDNLEIASYSPFEESRSEMVVNSSSDELRRYEIGRFAKIKFIEALLQDDKEWENISVYAYDYLTEMIKFKASSYHTTEGYRHDQIAGVAKCEASESLYRLFEYIVEHYSDKYSEWRGDDE